MITINLDKAKDITKERLRAESFSINNSVLDQNYIMVAVFG